jgi:hypothetical protein
MVAARDRKMLERVVLRQENLPQLLGKRIRARSCNEEAYALQPLASLSVRSRRELIPF